MAQLRLIDDRIAYLIERENCFEILNRDDIELKDDKGRVLSHGKNRRDWDKSRELNKEIFYTDEATRINFIECVKSDYAINNNQIKWVTEEEAVKMGFNNLKDGKGIITLNGIKIKWEFKKNYFDGVPHLEFTGVKDKEPNLISETGYRSCFGQWDLSNYNSAEEIVKDYVKEILKESKIDKKQKL